MPALDATPIPGPRRTDGRRHKPRSIGEALLLAAERGPEEEMVDLNTKVVVRTYSAGVHAGTLVRRDGKEVELADARRIWQWRGANSLHEVASKGVDSAKDSEYTRVSEPVVSIVLTEAIEIIQMTAAAWERISTAGWAE